MIEPRCFVHKISPYKVVSKREGAINLASNELQRPLTEHLRKAYDKSFAQILEYPDPICSGLIPKLSKIHTINENGILCGAGSSNVIARILSTFVGTGDEVITMKYSYLFFDNLTRWTGAFPNRCSVEHRDYRQLIKHIGPRTKALLIDNPNNPTGTILIKSEIRWLLEQIPEEVLVVHDCAYDEFVTNIEYDNCLDLVENYPNFVVVKTFSKIYGLAGCRIGWAYASPKIVQYVRRLQVPGDISIPNQRLAMAALDEVDRLNSIRSEVAEIRESLSFWLKSAGYEVFPSQGNFLLIRFPSDKSTEYCLKWLAQNNLIVRPMNGYGLSDCLRVTIGERNQMAYFKSLMNKFEPEI